MALNSPLSRKFRRTRNRTPFRARGRGGQWTPAYLGLRALYDYLGSSAAGIADGSGNAVAAVTVGAGAAAPLWLPYTTPAVYLPGVASNNITCPDAAALDITGDIEIVVRVAATDWTSAIQTLVAKVQSAAQRSYRCGVGATGIPVFLMSTDGTTESSGNAGAAVSFTDGSPGWLKITRAQTSGTTTFYTAADAETEPGSWTLLGTPATVSAGAAMFVGTSQIEIGTRLNGATEPFTGRVMRAIIRDGIGGATVFDFDAASCEQTGYSGLYSNVFTVGRSTSGRKTVVQSNAGRSARGTWLYGTDDYQSGPAAAISPATGAVSASAFCAFRLHATQASPKVLFSTRTGAGAGVTLRLASATTIVADVSDGTSTATTPAVTFTPGQMVVAGVFLDSGGAAFVRVNATTGSTVARPALTQTGGTLTIGADSTPANFADGGSVCGYAARDGMIDADEWARVVAYYQGGT